MARNQIVKAYVTPDEEVRIRAAAEALGMTLSTYARMVLLRACIDIEVATAERKGFTTKVIPITEAELHDLAEAVRDGATLKEQHDILRTAGKREPRTTHFPNARRKTSILVPRIRKRVKR